ncbi:MAG: M28 family peptidase [Bacteroidetes bacterium]|nr:MAG: M28 family peptidase [Bacteroidota bacterium]
MKIYLLAPLLLVLAQTRAQKAYKAADAFAKTITAADLKTHLTIIAGAEMEGRETATPGQKKAAVYIENYFKTLGLQPGNGSSYQQYYPVYRDSFLAAEVSINGQALALNTDFTPALASPIGSLGFGEVVYVNFEDSAWKNGKVDVQGKLVLFRFQGLSGAGANAGFGNTVGVRINGLMAKGAAAALVVQDIFPLTKPFERLTNMRTNKLLNRQSMAYFNISPAWAKGILGNDWEAATEGKLPSKVYKAEVQTTYNKQRLVLESSNVLALLPGTDKADEYLVITGHYDHIGRQGDVINFGADDDGSGTVSVLELAEAFAKAKAAGKGPRRSIVFMTVSGEEKGLWGSEYYANHPVYPLEKTTANLNIDMVGRLDSLHIKRGVSKYVYVVGDDKLSSDLTPISVFANKKTKLELDPKYNDPKDRERIYFRSDHYNFAKNGVPIIFYFNGVHPDYHRPTDTVDKIEFEVMSQRAQLVFYTAWDMVNRDAMLKRDIPLPASAMGR